MLYLFRDVFAGSNVQYGIDCLLSVLTLQLHHLKAQLRSHVNMKSLVKTMANIVRWNE